MDGSAAQYLQQAVAMFLHAQTAIDFVGILLCHLKATIEPEKVRGIQ